jgi:predicted dehydrogenase
MPAINFTFAQNSRMLKVGVLGAGHLGKIHIKLLKQIEDYELMGFYDPDKKSAAQASEEFQLKSFGSIEELIEAVEVVDIVTPTLSHFDCAVKALRNSRHIFIEKPITNTVAEAKQLIGLAEEANVKVQVGHVERFNPAFIASRTYIKFPMFIETHRLAQFNPRGTDVSVVLDLMIHDLDIVLSIVNSNVRRISASGVSVVSDTPDIANARIEFDNGCVANLTASRISLKNMRKTRIFQKDAYLSVDFLNKEAEIVRLTNVEGEEDPLSLTIDLGEGKGRKQIYFEKPDIASNNAIKDELQAFANAIKTNSMPPVTIYDGHNALDIAYRILEKLEHTRENSPV